MTRNRKRKAVSTILGVLIFIGIIFSAVIPMQLTMKQADMIQIRYLREREERDNLRDNENFNVVAYPTGGSSNLIKVRVVNRGDETSEVARIWIKDTYYTEDYRLDPGDSHIFGPYTVTLVEGVSYPVTVISNRGRRYSSEAGSLIYSAGTWYTPSFGVQVHIANDKGKYYIKVYNATWYGEYLTLGQDFNDLIVFFEVDTLGVYNVICKKNGPSGPDLPGTPMTVEITWPDGSPIVFVFTSGHDI